MLARGLLGLALAVAPGPVAEHEVERQQRASPAPMHIAQPSHFNVSSATNRDHEPGDHQERGKDVADERQAHEYRAIHGPPYP